MKFKTEFEKRKTFIIMFGFVNDKDSIGFAISLGHYGASIGLEKKKKV